MAIDWQYGKCVIECDDCGDEWTGDKGQSFSSVWADAKEAGWWTKPSTYKEAANGVMVPDEWEHTCPDCKD